jgi:hypothetical protein
VIDKKPFGYISFQPKAFLNAEILGKRDLNNSPMSDMIDLLTKLLHHSIGNNQALPDTLVKEEKSGFMSGFLSSLKTKK